MAPLKPVAADLSMFERVNSANCRGHAVACEREEFLIAHTCVG